MLTCKAWSVNFELPDSHKGAEGCPISLPVTVEHFIVLLYFCIVSDDCEVLNLCSGILSLKCFKEPKYCLHIKNDMDTTIDMIFILYDLDKFNKCVEN